MWTWPLWGLESTGQLLPKMIWIILWLKVLLSYLMHFNKNGNGKWCNQCQSTASLTNWFPVWLIIRVLIKEWHKLFHPSEIATSVPNRKLHSHKSTFVVMIIVVVDKHQADDHYEGHRQEYTGVEKMFSQTESFIENVSCLCQKMLQPEFRESQELDQPSCKSDALASDSHNHSSSSRPGSEMLLLLLLMMLLSAVMLLARVHWAGLSITRDLVTLSSLVIFASINIHNIVLHAYAYYYFYVF